MPQLTYTFEMQPAFAGMKAESVEDTVRSYVNEGAAAPFGVVFVQGSSDEAAALPSAASQFALGVAHHTHAYAHQGLAGDLGIDTQCMANVMRKGTVWVKVETAVAPGDPAFYRHTAPGVEQLGALRNDADVANADALGDSKFLTTAGAGELALLEVNLP